MALIFKDQFVSEGETEARNSMQHDNTPLIQLTNAATCTGTTSVKTCINISILKLIFRDLQLSHGDLL